MLVSSRCGLRSNHSQRQGALSSTSGKCAGASDGDSALVLPLTDAGRGVYSHQVSGSTRDHLLQVESVLLQLSMDNMCILGDIAPYEAATQHPHGY